MMTRHWHPRRAQPTHAAAPAPQSEALQQPLRAFQDVVNQQQRIKGWTAHASLKRSKQLSDLRDEVLPAGCMSRAHLAFITALAAPKLAL
eukprot:5430096-Amphidinium_carterae.1